MISEIEVGLRLLVATAVGFLIGFSRRNKPAGIRTFALITLGSAIFTLIGVQGNFSGSDPTRIIAQIVAGIGFLGLGVIWKHGIGKPTGLTTAAGIWVTAAIGVLIALGLWFETITGTILTLIIMISKTSLRKAKMEE